MDLGCDWSSRGSRPLPLSIPRQAVTVVGLAVKFSCRRHTEHKQINALGKFHLTESVGCIYSVRKKQFLCLKCIQKNQEVLFPQLTVKKLLSHWTICCLSLSTIDTSQRGKIWNHKTALSPRWGLPQKSPTAVFYIFKTNTFWKNYVAVTSFFESEDGSAAFLGSKKKKQAERRWRDHTTGGQQTCTQSKSFLDCMSSNEESSLQLYTLVIISYSRSFQSISPCS